MSQSVSPGGEEGGRGRCAGGWEGEKRPEVGDMRSRDRQDLTTSQGGEEDREGLPPRTPLQTGLGRWGPIWVPLRSAECGALGGRSPGEVSQPEHRHFDVPGLKNWLCGLLGRKCSLPKGGDPELRLRPEGLPPQNRHQGPPARF